METFGKEDGRGHVDTARNVCDMEVVLKRNKRKFQNVGHHSWMSFKM